MKNITINKHFKTHAKNYCVLGVLLSPEGILIKNEMLEWLKTDYDVITVEQQVPGVLYEYPAIDYAINLVKKSNEICLYVHTKGAANPGEIQNKIRRMWKSEFINHKEYYMNKYKKHLNDAIIICPFTGSDKNTWFNGFYITPEAARKTQKLTKQRRHYWEAMYKDNDKVKIIGRIFNDIQNIKDEDNIYYMLNYIKNTY